VSFTVLIPARFASTRLPGKPLLDIVGKPMVVRVAERSQASGADRRGAPATAASPSCAAARRPPA